MQVILLSMETTDRIAQWENMTQADPDNSMGWLSLGTAYKDAERTEDAVVALQKAIGLDQSLSRAYQLLGQVLVGLKRNDEAGQVLATGYTTAVRQGDVMPEKAMGTLLEKIGQAIPQVDRPVDTGRPVVDASTIVDRRTGRPDRDCPILRYAVPWVSSSLIISLPTLGTSGLAWAPKSSTNLNWTFQTANIKTSMSSK